MRSSTALRALVRKDLVLYFSNRRALVMSIAAPIVIAAFFGAIFGSGSDKPSRIPIALADRDASALSKTVAASVAADSAFDAKQVDAEAALALARQGKVRAAVILPPGFGEQVQGALFAGGAKPVVEVHYDPSQAAALTLVRGLLARHVMNAIGERVGGSASAGASFGLPFRTEAVESTAADKRYNGYAHAFAGMGVQFILFMGIEMGVGVLLARRMGLWKRLGAAPISGTLLLG